MMKTRSQSISLRGFFVSRCQVAGVSRRNYNEIATSWCIQMDSIQ
ncbi:unnamed protein product [Arabidopsis halleri]